MKVFVERAEDIPDEFLPNSFRLMRDFCPHARRYAAGHDRKYHGQPVLLILWLKDFRTYRQAGLASRRGAEEMIGRAKWPSMAKSSTELGARRPEKDHIKVRGKLINSKIRAQENVYLLLNKAKGSPFQLRPIPRDAKLVTQMVKGFGKLHPVGPSRFQFGRVDHPKPNGRRIHKSCRILEKDPENL
jgi:hypothetical protein